MGTLHPQQNRRVGFDCHWPSGCSDSARCNENGSCVAAVQAGGATFPKATPSSNQCDAWILWFADIDREQIHFGGHGAEVAARKAYDNAKMAWTCRLYHCISHSGFGPESAHETSGAEYERGFAVGSGDEGRYQRDITQLRAALEKAVQWAGPMAEAPADSRPEWFDIARAALDGTRG